MICCPKCGGSLEVKLRELVVSQLILEYGIIKRVEQERLCEGIDVSCANGCDQGGKRYIIEKQDRGAYYVEILKES